MSTTSTTTETTQERRERLLRLQEERQRVREAEAARQAAEFEEEMRRLEEEAAHEAELAAEKKRLEEEKIAEQARRAEEQRKESERSARDRARALKKLEEEKRKEKANSRVTDEAAKRRELAAAAALRRSLPQSPQPASGSQSHKKLIKSPSKVRDDSEELTEEEEEEVPAPRGVKRKVMTVMEVLLIPMIPIPRREIMVTVRILTPLRPPTCDLLVTGVSYNTAKTSVARRRGIDEHRHVPFAINSANGAVGPVKMPLVDRGLSEQNWKRTCIKDPQGE
ncbi:hypothetical protein F5890DRAFT_1559930 [Lentinula detonsa]|uniref:Uncharacterized protein n=1 Tax=Lentinula detonsa TaxID=2804962 RepID=A0AA38PN79_9AGAR|nr:hypothetical protein F5890DRAFT_1559930 [Lentinula detonsa]